MEAKWVSGPFVVTKTPESTPRGTDTLGDSSHLPIHRGSESAGNEISKPGGPPRPGIILLLDYITDTSINVREVGLLLTPSFESWTLLTKFYILTAARIADG